MSRPEVTKFATLIWVELIDEIWPGTRALGSRKMAAQNGLLIVERSTHSSATSWPFGASIALVMLTLYQSSVSTKFQSVGWTTMPAVKVRACSGLSSGLPPTRSGMVAPVDRFAVAGLYGTPSAAKIA